MPFLPTNIVIIITTKNKAIKKTIAILRAHKADSKK